METSAILVLHIPFPFHFGTECSAQRRVHSAHLQSQLSKTQHDQPEKNNLYFQSLVYFNAEDSNSLLVSSQSSFWCILC